MKVLSTNLNQNSPIYSQNKNCKQSNVNFEAHVVLELNEAIFKKLVPTSVPLSKKFLDTKLGRGCRITLKKFFDEAIFKKIGMAKKKIFIDVDEQKQLDELITAATDEVGVPSHKNARVMSIPDAVFNPLWNGKRTACARLKKYVEGLINDAEEVPSKLLSDYQDECIEAVEPITERYARAIAKKPESMK